MSQTAPGVRSLEPGARSLEATTRPLPRLSLPQHLSSLLRRRRIDVEPRPPLEPRHLGQLRHQLQVPVVHRLEARRLERRAVDDQVVGRRRRARFIRCSVSFSIRARLSYSWRGASSNADPWRFGTSHVSNANRGAYGDTARNPRSPRSRASASPAPAARCRRTRSAPSARNAPARLELVTHVARDDRQGDELRVRVFQRRARR